MTEPRRLVAVAWQRSGTGLTRVADRLLGSLGEEWQVDLVGVGYEGPVATEGGVTRYPSDPNGRDVFGTHAAAALCARAPRPAAVLIHNDVWLLPRYADVLGPHLEDVPLLAYVPLDGEADTLPPEMLAGLRSYRAIAVYTEWARGTLARALAASGDPGPLLEIVPHGVDLDVFVPAGGADDARPTVAGRTALKRRLFPDLPEPGDTVLVLNANRPDIRKRIDLTLEAFAHSLRLAPGVEARLVLHHAIDTPEVARSLRLMAERLGIEDKVVFNPLGPEGVAPDGSLAELMAACEIGLNTSMGEGWGLLAFEHAATGGAQVLGRHSAHSELWNGAAVLVEPARRRVGASSPLALAELDSLAVGEALAELYRDPRERNEVSRRCRARATDPRFGWDVAEAAFKGFLERGRAPAAPPPLWPSVRAGRTR